MLCQILKDKFQGWAGGSGLGNENGTAFWGGYPDHKVVTDYVLKYNRDKNARTVAMVKSNQGNIDK